MSTGSYFAEDMVLDAINYGLNKDCKVTVLFAGPICSGKLPIVEGIRKWFKTVRKCDITVIDQNSFYKSLSDIEMFQRGYNIDSPDSFYTDEFTKKVKQFFETGKTFSPYYDFDEWTRGKPEFEKHFKNEAELKAFRYHCEKYNEHHDGMVNIIYGPHVISLLSEIVPNSITIYLNTDFHICMQRRLSMNRYLKVANISGIGGRRAYEYFVYEENELSVFPQKELANLVIQE